MTVLYISEPGAVLRRDGEGWTVTVDPADASRQVLARVEGHRLQAVVLVGRAHATTEALHLCLHQGVALAWLERGGRLLGRLQPPQNRSAGLRLGQYRLAVDTAARLGRAKIVTAAKIDNAAAVLRRLQSNRPGQNELGQAIATLRGNAAAIDGAADPAALLGIEGLAARTYFAALSGVFPVDMPFVGRARRPPPDPVNALLSFGYVLMAIRLGGLLESLGLDPAIGFLHDLRPGRESLALDLLEELRHPVVDQFVLRLCNLSIMTPGNFEPDPERAGGVRLDAESLKRFFGHWEDWMNKGLPDMEGDSVTPHALIRRQAERLSEDLHGGEPYRPFRFRG